MITDLYDHQLEATYSRFVGLLGSKPWIKVTQDHQRQFAANPLSKEQITREYRVAYGLTHFDQLGMALYETEIWPTVIHALTFAAQVCELAEEGIEDRSREAYIGRVKGAFKNSDDMRALSFEHLTALSLYRQGLRIHWPDDSTGPETYDLLVTTQDGMEIEVECKSNSADKGRAIPLQDATEFLNRLRRQLPTTLHAGQALAVKVRVPQRLPKAHAALDLLVSEVVGALLAGAATTGGNVSIAQKTLDAPFLLKPQTNEYLKSEIGKLADREFGTAEGYRIVAYDETSKNVVCIEVASGRAPRIFNALWETAKHAVQNQMTGRRPGCLVMRMEGLTHEELIRLASDDPSPLAVFATKVLTDPRHQHLACLAFISDFELVSLSETQQSEQSASFVVNQEVGPYALLRLGQLLQGRSIG